METKPLQTRPLDARPSPDPTTREPRWQEPPPTDPGEPGGGGLRPTDPTRSGALWVGGAGVALLLAAAAVLTAVRWDDIGQSAKLGGLALITATLLAAGRRFTSTIPMTSQALFHLGALLIPFDMAAVAMLAGRTWQETLLLTSVTTVVALYGIERAVPSIVLRIAAGVGVVGLSAGVAAVTEVAMAPALAVAAAIAIAVRKPTEAAVWALMAGVLPVAVFVEWPWRIVGAMNDLGLDGMDRVQPLVAGVLSTLVLIAVTRMVPRMEIAWSAIVIAMVTLLVNVGGFADVQGGLLTLAVVILSLELAAIATDRNPLWKPIMALVATLAELLAAATTAALFALGALATMTTTPESLPGYGAAAALLALAWVVADARRVDDDVDWLTALVMGSDWSPTTIMFPAAVLAAVTLFGVPLAGVALVALALAFWMVATWRSGSTYGALGLVALAAVAASQAGPWIELLLGGVGAGVLSYAARQRVRARDDFVALTAACASVFIWLVSAESLLQDHSLGWPLLLVLIGAWATSWALDVRTAQPAHAAHYIGRASACALLIASLWIDSEVSLAMAIAVMALAAVDYVRTMGSGEVTGAPATTAYAVIFGAALGVAGVPVAALVGLSLATAGATLAGAGFVLVGIALVSPQSAELALASAAVTTSALGLVLSLGQASTFAIALVAVGASVMFAAAGLRDLAIGVTGYIVCGLGVSLQLAVWHVMWLEPYLALPALAALAAGYHFQRSGISSWATYAPTVALLAYVSIAERWASGSAWHAVIAGGIGVMAVIAGGYGKLVGPLISGSVVLAVVVGYESLGPAALVPTWAWLATGGAVLLAAGVAIERSDTSPLERGQQIRSVITTQYS